MAKKDKIIMLFEFQKNKKGLREISYSGNTKSKIDKKLDEVFNAQLKRRKNEGKKK